GEEQMALVPIDLGPLVLVLGVFQRQRVQPEFLAQHGQVVGVRVKQVKPDDGALVADVLTDIVDGEALGGERAVSVEPGPRLASGGRDGADGGRGNGRAVATEGNRATWTHRFAPDAFWR